MKISIVLFLIFLLVISFGCMRQSEKPNISMETASKKQPVKLDEKNEIRRKLGLRVIEANWVLYQAEGDSNIENWKINGNGSIIKVVFKDAKGQVLEDEDYYYSGNEYTDGEEHGWEQLTVHYNFTNNQIYLAYMGTNNTIKSTLSKYFVTIDRASSNVVGALTDIRKVASNWPDGPK